MRSIKLCYFQRPRVTLTTPNHPISVTSRHCTKTAEYIELALAQASLGPRLMLRCVGRELGYLQK